MNTTLISENTAVSIINQTPVLFKPYNELTIADDFVFGKIFQNKDIFRQLLEILLHTKFPDDIASPITQKSYRVAPDRKRIATDVSTHTAQAEFDVEMQQESRPNLPKRCRYYQAAMDVNFLQRKFEYTQLKENFVIFICLQDPFGRGLPVYTFRNVCLEDTNVQLGDGTTKIFYNAKNYAKLADKEASAIMQYMSTNTATTDYTATLDGMVDTLRTNPLWCKEYLDAMQEDLLREHEAERRGREAGIKEGELLGEHKAKLAAARNLKKLNVAPEIIAEATGLPLADIYAL